jgi:hypothetical protein
MTTAEADTRRGISRALSHPAALLVLTAVLTGLLVPWITNRWEARDKQVEAHRVAAERELEVKSAIVSRVGTASARFLSASEVGVIDAAGPEARAEFRSLKTASLEIGSQLAAYFPRSRPETHWRDYTFSLRNIYVALTSSVGRPRSQWVHLLNRYLDLPPRALLGLCFSPTDPRFARDLRELILAFQHKEEQVVREIVASATVLTGTPLADVTVRPTTFKATQRRTCD